MPAWMKTLLRDAENEGAGGGAALPQRPDPVAEDHWDQEAGRPTEAFYAHYTELAAAHGQQQERLASLPKDADGYEIALPDVADLGIEGLPENFALSLDENDPRIPALKQFAHENGLSQEQLTGLMMIEGRRQAVQFQSDLEAHEKTLKDLGPQAQARINAVQGRLKAISGGEVPPILDAVLADAASVKVLEKLFSTVPGTSGAGAGGQGAALPENATASEMIAHGLKMNDSRRR